MTTQDRRRWLVLATMFATSLLVYGAAVGSAGVFIAPLAQHFGWSRTQITSFHSATNLVWLFCTMPIGWLFDKIEARFIIAVGIVLTSLGLLAASQVTTYPEMLATYILIGSGVAASTLLPTSVVIANWFVKRRGLAIALATAGMSSGGMVMTLTARFGITHGGWSSGYIAIALPMLVMVPIVLIVVRTRPPAEATATAVTVAKSAEALPGLDVKEALRGRSFWLIIVATVCTGVATTGAFQIVAYFGDVGYSANTAALFMSIMYGATSIGKLGCGWVSDRLGSRLAFAGAMTLAGGSLALFVGAPSNLTVALLIPLYGLTFLTPLALIPILSVDALGLRRYGTLSGMIGVAHTLGATIGPVMGGRMFDVFGSYRVPFTIYAALFVLAGLAGLGARVLTDPRVTREWRRARA